MATKDITDTQVCQATYLAAGQTPREVDRVLATLTGQPGKVCWRALERAAGRGLIDCGVSLRSAFLTPAGCTLLGLPASAAYGGTAPQPLVSLPTGAPPCEQKRYKIPFAGHFGI